jgi:hypothetical protein
MMITTTEENGTHGLGAAGFDTGSNVAASASCAVASAACAATAAHASAAAGPFHVRTVSLDSEAEPPPADSGACVPSSLNFDTKKAKMDYFSKVSEEGREGETDVRQQRHQAML